MSFFSSPLVVLVLSVILLAFRSSPDVIIVGENHTSREDHLRQLEVIQQLYRYDKNIIIAMEMFQQQFQPYLDMYINGTIQEEELLEKTEYRKRWGYDFSLYRDILNFARESRIKVIAINLPSEVVKEIREKGIEAVSTEYLPKEKFEYTEKELEFIYSAIKEHKVKDRKKFIDVQYAWDVGMAYKIVKIRNDFPQHKIVVLVGKGHTDTISRFIGLMSKDIKVLVY